MWLTFDFFFVSREAKTAPPFIDEAIPLATFLWTRNTFGLN